MESFIAFIVTFAAAVPLFVVAAVFLFLVRRRMVLLRHSEMDPREKRLRGLIGCAASASTAPLVFPAVYLFARGGEAAEAAVIVSSLAMIPLSFFMIPALVSSIRAVVSARGR